MNITIKKILVDVIKVLSPKVGRKPSQEIDHYIDKFLHVLDSDCKWKYLKGPLNHDTYRKKLIYWSRLGIFEKAHEIIGFLLGTKFYNNELLKKLYMDSTDIMNKQGFDCIGRSKKCKFKNATKINIITDQFGIILAINIVSANKNDSTLTEETINKMCVKIIHSRKYPKYLITDKGYISKKTKNIINKKVTLIYPDKINTVNSPYNYSQNKKRVEFLKSRFINENAFAWLKNSKRTTVRYDHILDTFKSFVYLQAFKVIGKKIDLLNIQLL